MSAPTLTDDLVTVRDTLYDDGESPAEVAFDRIEQRVKAQEAALREISNRGARVEDHEPSTPASIARAALSSVDTEAGT